MNRSSIIHHPSAAKNLTVSNAISRHLTVSNAQNFRDPNTSPDRSRRREEADPHIAKSSRIKLNQGKYSRIKAPQFSRAGRPQTYSDLIRPVQSCSDLNFILHQAAVLRISSPPSDRKSYIVNRKSLSLNTRSPIGAYCHQWSPIVTECYLSENLTSVLRPPISCRRPPRRRLALTPCSQPKAIVGDCRLSKIRPKTYTLNLNTRNAGLQTGKSRAIPASSLSLNTLEAERGQPVRFQARPAFSSAATAVQHHRESLQRVAPCRTVLHRVAPKIIWTPLPLCPPTSDIRPLPYSALFSLVQHYSALKKIYFFSRSSPCPLCPPC